MPSATHAAEIGPSIDMSRARRVGLESGVSGGDLFITPLSVAPMQHLKWTLGKAVDAGSWPSKSHRRDARA